jgi:hypothetical protein
MADIYRFGVGFVQGTAKVEVFVNTVLTATFTDGIPGALFIEQGAAIEIVVTLDPGYTSFSAAINRVTGSPFTSSPININMPDFDTRAAFTIAGAFTPPDDYELKYYFDWKVKPNDDDRRLEIYEDGYTGSSLERRIKNLTYQVGNRGDSIIETFMRSKIDFELLANSNDFFEFLTGDNRKFKVKYYHDIDVVFEGYVLTDRLTVPEKDGVYFLRFEAIDGMRSFDSNRLNFARVQRSRPVGILCSALNQTFIDGRAVNISCDIYEDAMDNTNCMFDEFGFPYTAVYNDGLVARFDDGTRIVNETLFLEETIKRIVNPFFCNVFLFMNEWYVIRLGEFLKDTMKFFRYEADGTFDDDYTVSNGYTLDCGDPKFGNAQREAGLIFNEFNSVFKLGALSEAAQGGIFDFPFNNDSFIVATGSGGFPEGTYILKLWEYNRCQPLAVNRQVGTDNNIADIGYNSTGSDERMEIIKTTTNAGFADANISFLELSTASSGVAIPVIQEGANSISLFLKFNVSHVLSAFENVTPTTYRFAIMVRIGDNWLDYDATTNTYSWSATETLVSFPITNRDTWNEIQITDVVVPATGNAIFRIYQLIAGSGTVNQLAFKVRVKDFKFTVTQTEGLANAEILYKSQTLSSYNRVHPDYVTWIGDVGTVNSLSQIVLLNGEASKEWSDVNDTSVPLQANQVQVLANFLGRRNQRVYGTLYFALPDFTKRMDYDGKKWKINYLSNKDEKNETEIEMIEIQD